MSSGGKDAPPPVEMPPPSTPKKEMPTPWAKRDEGATAGGPAEVDREIVRPPRSSRSTGQAGSGDNKGQSFGRDRGSKGPAGLPKGGSGSGGRGESAGRDVAAAATGSTTPVATAGRTFAQTRQGKLIAAGALAMGLVFLWSHLMRKGADKKPDVHDVSDRRK